MTSEEAKKILIENRPNKPRKTEGRRLQAAIDVAVQTIDDYNNAVKYAFVTIGGRNDQ